MIETPMWEACGVRVRLWPAARKGNTQEWKPPFLAVTYLVAPALHTSEDVLAVIDMLAEAGHALREALEDFTPGVLL